MSVYTGEIGGPVADRATTRTLALMIDAQYAVRQALYEGSHRQRQEPEPRHGSPWARPDLPVEIKAKLFEAECALRQAVRLSGESMTEIEGE